jgi:hypothetical protein
MEDIFRGTGIEVNIKTPENFLKIAETLTRIGISSKDSNRLYQSCHILHKKDKEGYSHYAIEHFKEMFILDGKTANFDENDIPRRNTITKLLQDWGLLTIVTPQLVQEFLPIQMVKIIPFKDKSKYELIAKYKIGIKKGNNHE